MKLKRLTLHGFKSFADRTEFEFDAGLTGIIGPNGCGKSNVVDAVKWVLGDQRPTSQRGKEMLDVVFHGAEGRPGTGHAAVTLVLERDRDEVEGLDGPPAEMMIGRRLFRSGESEYLLDNRPVRLKDIREALLDTGLGVGGYSVMEQGRIDAVLSQNPDERRSIFDEAAGISRYKLRRKEALHKLDKTEINLARVKDLRQEKASRVRSLKIQATRARSFRETDERLMAVAVAVAVLDSIDLRASLDGVEAELAAAEERLRALEAERERARRELFEVEDEARALAARHGEIKDLAATLRTEERSRREALEGAKKRIASLGETATRAAAESERARVTLARDQTELDELRRQDAELGRCLAVAANELPALRQEAAGARRRLEETRRERERVRAILLEAMHDRTRAKNRVHDEAVQSRAIDGRRRRLEEAIGDVERRIADSVREGVRDQGAAEVLASRLDRLRARIADYERRMSDVEKDRDDLVGRLHELLRERSAVRSQLALLEDLEASHTGLGDAARDLLADGRGIHGKLIDHIDCPLEVGPAVEAVLGARVEALVVADFARAEEALDALAGRRGGGRLVLVDNGALPGPRPAPPAAAATPDAGSLPDGGVALASFCRVADPVRGLFADLLDGVRLVRDLGCARSLRAGPKPPRLIVTLRGDLVGGPWIEGGASEAAAGPLQRKATLDVLRRELAGLGTRIEDAERQRAGLDTTLARRARLHERLEEVAAATLRDRTAIEQKLAARRARENELRLGIDQDREELRELEAERLACVTRMMGPMLDTLRLARHESRLEDEQRRLDGEVQAQEGRVGETQDRLAELQSRKAGLEAEVAGFGERRTLLERSLGELRDRVHALADQAMNATREREQLAADRQRWKGELADYACRARFVEELAAKAAESVTGLEAAAGDQRRAAAAADDELGAAREQRSNLLVRSKEVSLRLSRIDDEVWDDYRIELARLRGEVEGRGLWTEGPVLGPPPPPEGPIHDAVAATSLQGPPLPPDFWDRERRLPRLWEDPEFDREAAARETEVLRARMQRMGNVNLAAEAELDRVREQQEQLERDCIDLEQARRQLIETLQRINVESRQLFEHTFEAARRNFQDLFRKLFQGGRADVQLVDAEDPLDSGIEILARPPGKELRSIRLLSGGERSLTALAMLFAVFQIKPSPFCILDEVDAALDEANVDRFLRVLRDFAGETQFLVVTHHKRTMAECKVLYGITMPRKGVSSPMSVSLADVASGEVDHVIQPAPRMPRIADAHRAPAARPAARPVTPDAAE